MPFNLSKFPGLDEEEAGRKCWLENVEDQGRLTLDFLPPPPLEPILCQHKDLGRPFSVSHDRDRNKQTFDSNPAMVTEM